MAWSASKRDLWARIAAHAPGGAAAAAFEARVARDNGWNRAETREAIAEYRRFVFLACTGAGEATPSKAIDAVWHAHLLFTRDYWDAFCPRVLGMALHHHPGDAGDDARHAAQYERTLRDYEAHFGTPPPRWWPARAAPAPRRAPGGVMAAAFVALPALALAASRPANPLDWQGGDFLRLYGALLVATWLGSLAWRAWLRRRAGDVRDPGPASTLEIAYLAGGEARAVDAAVAELHRRGAIAWDAGARRFERRDTRHALEGELDEFATALASAPDATGIAGRAAAATGRLRANLERRGLWQRREEARRIGRLAALPALALLFFGVAKIAIGVQRERPVTALVVLCALTALLALVMYINAPRPTRAGAQALQRARASQRATKHGRGVDDLGLAVALGGTALLSGTALAGYHELRAPPASDPGTSGTSDSPSGSDDRSYDSADASSGSDSGDGGGSSCGGCGGGGGD